jgi:hypothetical protein
MDETLKGETGEANVWDHEGKVHLAIENRCQDRVQIAMTPEEARQLAEMLVSAGFESFRSLLKPV